MSSLSTFARSFDVRSYRQHAGQIEYRDGRWEIWGPDGEYWGTRRRRDAAVHALEQNMLGELYRPAPEWARWPDTWPETKRKSKR
jgi:hypothetical protein